MSTQAVNFSEIANYYFEKSLFMVPAATLVFSLPAANQPPEPLKGLAFASIVMIISGLAEASLLWTLTNYANADCKSLSDYRPTIGTASMLGTGLLFNYLGFPVFHRNPQFQHQQ